ncbi:MAG: hypothetical protein P4L53_13440 [Candidatus Obscuribacterales bacterium]|nr:hypothetical protein [Candidatus Obscuribacterales bacterium]
MFKSYSYTSIANYLQRFPLRRRAIASLLLLATTTTFCCCGAVLAKRAPPDPALTHEQVSQLEKAKRMARTAGPKANQLIISVVATATDTAQCLAMAEYADSAGFTLLDARKASLQKAIDLSKSKDDLILTIIKSRKLQCFEITSAAIKALLNGCSDPADLYDLAKKCQEIALVDVTRLALEKILAQTQNAKDAIALAHQSRTLGLDDFARKIVKDVEDDCQTTPECLELLPQIENLKYSDATRYLVKKALERAKTVDEYLAVNKAAVRTGQQDIVNNSAWHGRYIILTQQAAEQAARDRAAKDQATKDAQSEQATQTKNAGAGF